MIKCPEQLQLIDQELTLPYGFRKRVHNGRRGIAAGGHQSKLADQALVQTQEAERWTSEGPMDPLSQARVTHFLPQSSAS